VLQTIPMSESRIAKLLRERETNHYFYREVREMLLMAAAALHAHPITAVPTTAREAAGLALEVAASRAGLTGSSLSSKAVAAVASDVASRINDVVKCHDDTPSDQLESHTVMDCTASTVPEHVRAQLPRAAVDAIERLFNKAERWRGRCVFH
jgi:hypothetical protein